MFFDGVCNLCNTTVDFLIRRDKKRLLRYSPLQGETAARLLTPEQRGDLRSFVLLDHEGTFVRSTGALRTLAKLGGVWSLAKVLLIVPRFIRDAVYNAIATGRYRLWGKRDSCRVATPEERSLFLP